MQPVLDGHNDVLMRLWETAGKGGDPIAEFRDGITTGHIDGPRARAGGLVGGLCAIFVPSRQGPRPTFDRGTYSSPLAEPIDQPAALAAAVAMAGIARRLDREGVWRLCTSTVEIRRAIDDDVFAAVLHMEGCDPIDADLYALDLFYAAGLRSLGPVWSRTNIFGHGVPFAYPSSPDTGPGLTDAGVRLVKACNRLGIMIDLSHITEQGFWDVAKVSEMPLVATHSNVHAITPVTRNLTDRQMAAIRETGGMVGLNYATSFLRPDGQENAATPLTDMVRHVDHLVEHLGIDGVGLGSDYDGATIPSEIGDAAGQQALVGALRQAGYGEDDLVKLCRDNWLRVLAQTWRE
ncbi:peptidase [Pleomorphomonas diazotrophica]|uniref:Peptidase n=1 Tax=Pleomorphomonas diazotrophica TaxID=1166257 RepID=A0A1I4QL62_9HYPH|nr:dipeptidase [Pleomorphomonas diazotrophica]PKR90584.1 peptidase [Pleomorphomonas diazotrophica]SFM40797.1 dipeptidase AC. Metallo peptidase. MEROPS family M19 [Pleomorphomonas diazotrophica]